MFRGRNRGRGRGRGATDKVPLKGLFADGVWHCNCEPRVPAEHFETKNGGKNHGRWFYTCQKTQPKRCNFFLWDDEAKPREAAAVLSNSRTEPGPQTPERAVRERSNATIGTPVTPSTINPAWRSSTSSSFSTLKGTDEEFFDWPNSDDEEIVKVADHAAMPPPETPRKAVKINDASTPGKRRYDETSSGPSAWLTPTSGNSDDIFTTPATSPLGKNLFSNIGLPSPSETPTPQRFKDIAPGEDSELALEVLQVSGLKHLNEVTRDAVKDICNTYAMRTQGIAKGRDISRVAIKAKDAKITDLQGRIAALEAERETSRAVIRHLKRDGEMRGKRT